MNHWDSRLVQFMTLSGDNRNGDMQSRLSHDIDLLGKIASSDMILRIEFEDDITAKVKDASPSFLNDIVLNPEAIQEFLAEYNQDIIFLPSLFEAQAAFNNIFIALSTAVIVRLQGVLINNIVVIGWSESFGKDDDMLHFMQSAKIRLEETSTNAVLLARTSSERNNFLAVLQGLPQAIVFIDQEGFFGWINKNAAVLLSLPMHGAQPPHMISQAMAKWRNTASNKDAIAQKAAAFFTSPSQPVKNWIWLFESGQKKYNVSCSSVNNEQLKGILWTFDDISDVAI